MTKHANDLLIETPRLLIRPWRVGDTAYYAQLSKDVGYNCFSLPGYYSYQNEVDLQQKVLDRVNTFRNFGWGKFLLLTKEKELLVGTAGVDPFELDEKPAHELGYRLLLQHWGKGLATEAAHALIADTFERLRLSTLYTFALPQNPASLKVMEKVGFAYQRNFVFKGWEHKLYAMDSPFPATH